MLTAIIGLGEIASKAYLPVLNAWEGAELALCSRSAGTVAKNQAQYRIRLGTSRLDDLFEWGVKAAFVLTPNETHFEIATRLLEKGVDVFLEKPATLHSRETQALAEQADRLGRVLMVGFNRRYAPIHVRARQLWGERAVGMASFEKHRANASHPHLEHQFTDDTIHQIDLLRFFCGEGEVTQTVQYVNHERLLGAASTVALERGGFAMIVTSLQAGRWQEFYTLHGGGMSLHLDAFSRLRLIGREEDRLQEERYASSWISTLEGRGFHGQIGHFFECVEKRLQPQTSAWDSVKTQQMVESMVERLVRTQVSD